MIHATPASRTAPFTCSTAASSKKLWARAPRASRGNLKTPPLPRQKKVLRRSRTGVSGRYTENGKPDSRPEIRGARAAEEPGLRADCGADAGARNRREHGAFFGGQRRAVAAFAFSARWRIGCPLRKECEFRQLFRLVSQFSGLAAQQFQFCFLGSVSRRRFQHYRKWRSGARARGHGFRKLLPNSGSESGPRPLVYRRR